MKGLLGCSEGISIGLGYRFRAPSIEPPAYLVSKQVGTRGISPVLDEIEASESGDGQCAVLVVADLLAYRQRFYAERDFVEECDPSDSRGDLVV